MGDAYVVAEADFEGVRLDRDTALGRASDRGGARAGLSARPGRGRRRVTVRVDDQPELRADSKRTFRYLVNQDAGCRAATQFVGLVETFHPAGDPASRSYDAVVPRARPLQRESAT